jgi:iron complex outermembrane receptor protein
VINMVTHTAGGFDGIEVSADGGTFGTGRYSILTSHSIGRLGVTTSFQFRNTDGPTVPIEQDAQTVIDRLGAPFGIPAASLAPGPTTDDRRSEDALVSAKYRGFGFDARVRNIRSGGFIGQLDALGRSNELRTRQIVLAAEQALPIRAQTRVTARFNVTQSLWAQDINPLPPGFTRLSPDGGPLVFPDGVLVDFESKSRRFAGSAIAERQVAASHQVIAGTSLERENTYDIRNAGNYDPFSGRALPGVQPLPFPIVAETSRRIFSAFVQDAWNVVPRVGITAGVRYDHYSDFGNTVNPRAAAVVRLPHDLYVKAMYGRAFRAPSIFEATVNIPNAVVGNPALAPSTINTYEVAMIYKKKRLRLSGNVFAARLRDLILPTKPLAAGGIGTAQTFANAPGLNTRGLEFEARQAFGFDNSVFFNLTLQDPEVRATGDPLPDVPTTLANAGLTLGLGKFVVVSPTLLVRGSRPRDMLDVRPKVPARGLVNINVRLRNLFETLEFSAVVTNLFDKSYVDPSPFATLPVDYPRAGRSALLGIAYKF